jgi:hypothetical protein
MCTLFFGQSVNRDVLCEQSFSPRIHLSEPDFWVLIDADLLPEDKKLGPVEFEAVMRRQLLAFSQARLSNVPPVRTASDSDFLLFNTLKMVLMQLLPQSQPWHPEQLFEQNKGSPHTAGVPSKEFRRDPLEVSQVQHKVTAASADKKETGGGMIHCSCCCCPCGNHSQQGQSARGSTSSRRAHKRMLDLEEIAMSKFMQSIAGPVRDRLLSDVVDPLGREIARLREGFLPAKSVDQTSGNNSGDSQPAEHFGNDLVLLHSSRSAPVAQENRCDVGIGEEASVWLFPKANRYKKSSNDLQRRGESGSTRGHAYQQHSESHVGQQRHKGSSDAEAAAERKGIDQVSSGACSTVRAHASSSQCRQSTRYQQLMPRLSPAAVLSGSAKRTRQSIGSGSLLLDGQRCDMEVAPSSARASVSHAPGWLVGVREDQKDHRQQDKLSCAGLVSSDDPVHVSRREGGSQSAGSGLMMHMRFSVTQ